MAENLKLQQVIDIVADELGVTNTSIFAQDQLAELGVDSLDRVAIAVRLEDAFEIVISDIDLVGIRTVGDFADFVRSALQQRQEPHSKTTSFSDPDLQGSTR